VCLDASSGRGKGDRRPYAGRFATQSIVTDSRLSQFVVEIDLFGVVVKYLGDKPRGFTV